MKREIKFRVYLDTTEYDKDSEDFGKSRMLSWDDMNDYMEDPLNEYFSEGILGCSPPMQFTGFNDVDGKEIYEGDILDDKYKWTVVFKDGCWFAVSKHNQDLLGIVQRKRQIAGIPLKIVGNIFES